MTERRPRGAREAALRFLLAASSAPARDTRRRTAAALPPAERGLFVELTAGVTRSRLLYDAVIEAYASARLERIERRLLNVLRLGLHQILRLERMPPHAAVASVLELLPSKRARAFANAILRSILREGRFLSPSEAATAAPRRLLPLDHDRHFLAGRDILPDPATDRLGHRALAQGFTLEAASILEGELGDEVATQVMTAANRRPLVTLRRDPTRSSSSEEFTTRLAGEGLEVEAEDAPGLLYRLQGGDPAATEAFREGLFQVQGSFASQVAPLLAPQAGERVLDLCAPPGGKTLHLSELAPEAQITAFAHDADGRRRLLENLARRGTANIEVVSGADPFARGPYEACLLDVPCSNSGVLGRRAEARERLTAKDLESLAQVQTRLLERALQAFEAKGGRLVYGTCSILPRENEKLVRSVLEAHPRATIEAEIRSLPDLEGRDGGYAVLIRIPAARA